MLKGKLPSLKDKLEALAEAEAKKQVKEALEVDKEVKVKNKKKK